jgi:hypothetical protein
MPCKEFPMGYARLGFECLQPTSHMLHTSPPPPPSLSPCLHPLSPPPLSSPLSPPTPLDSAPAANVTEQCSRQSHPGPEVCPSQPPEVIHSLVSPGLLQVPVQVYVYKW